MRMDLEAHNDRSRQLPHIRIERPRLVLLLECPSSLRASRIRISRWDDDDPLPQAYLEASLQLYGLRQKE